MILPWHNPEWCRIVDALDTIHHGILLQGLPGTGLREFSIELSRILLCEKPDYDAATWCDNCQNCRLFGAGTHPDFHLLSSERGDQLGDIASLELHDVSTELILAHLEALGVGLPKPIAIAIARRTAILLLNLQPRPIP